MERAKELTGNDFDPLFEDLSGENAALAAEMMRESYNSFRAYVQSNSTFSSSGGDGTRSTDQIRETAPFANAKESTSVGSTVFAHAGCPPPRLVSSAAFDDTVIKLLGDCGGTDEILWDSLQLVSLETSTLRAASGSLTRAANGQFNPFAEPDSQSQSHSQLTDTADAGADPAADTAYSEQRGQLEDLMELIRKYGKSLVASLRSEAGKELGGQPAGAIGGALAKRTTTTADQCSPLDLADRVNSLRQQPSSAAAQSSHHLPPLHPSQPAPESVRLGKRGRYFLDVWDEEEFISRLRAPTRLRPLYQWEDLFREGSYCDNHDGCYRDWLLGHQEAAKARLNDPKAKKNKRRSTDPIFRYDTGVMTENSGLSAIAPPPVPVAIQHPASWAIIRSSERNAAVSDDGRIDVSVVHPASISSGVVLPVHQKLRSSAQAAAASAANTSSETAGDTVWSGVSPLDAEDVDDFNVYADRLLQSLQAQEVANFVRLARLQSAIAVHSHPQVRAVQDKRRKLEELMGAAALSMEPTSADRVVYAFKPNKAAPAVAQAAVLGRIHGDEMTGRSGEVIRLDIRGNVIPRKLPLEAAASSSSQSKYNTRCADGASSSSTSSSSLGLSSSSSSSSSAKADPIKLRRDLVGGSSARHVAHGAALAQCLVPEAEVEVCVNKMWQVATVVRVMYDGEHIRHVKVVPLDCTAMESVWVSVEDGKIAPCGTHLRPIATPAAIITVAASTSAHNSSSTLVGKTPQAALRISSPTSSLIADDDDEEKKKAQDQVVVETADVNESQDKLDSAAMDVQDDDEVILAQEMFSTQKKDSTTDLPGGDAPIAKTAVVTRENSAQNGTLAHSSARSSPFPSVPVIYMSNPNNMMIDTVAAAPVVPPPRPLSMSLPAVPVAAPVTVPIVLQQPLVQPQAQQHALQQVSQMAQVSHSQPAGSGMDAFRQSSAMIGFVSDPRLRKTASLQDYHSHSSPGHHSHNGRVVSMGGGTNVPIHSASFGYAGSVAMDSSGGGMNGGARVRIPLPMGATDKRDLIAAVSPFTPLPLSYMPAALSSGPQPFNPYTRHRYGSGQVGVMQQYGIPGMGMQGMGMGMGVHGGVAVGVPYAYEYEGAGEVHQRPVYDSVGFHTTHRAAHDAANANVNTDGVAYGNADTNNNREGFGVGVSGTSGHGANGATTENGGYIMLPPSSASGDNTTFRLGKKGAITRN